VVGGWWYPEDGQVDNRVLIKVLRTAAENLGVIFEDRITVEAISQQQGKVTSIQTNAGLFHANHYLLATGAWTNQLLPLPMRPRKGQMLSLRVPDFVTELPLTRILFGPLLSVQLVKMWDSLPKIHRKVFKIYCNQRYNCIRN
jgi:thiazole synthase